MPDPKEYNNESDWMGYCVPKMMGKGKDNDQAVAACMSMWKDKGSADDGEEMQTNFIFTELSHNAEDLKFIDGMAAGTFTTMRGQDVTFDPSDLQSYVDNTKVIIESTRTEKGEIVGLPIDKANHDHQGGAGWIVDLELDKARNVIKFMVKWTKEGYDLIAGNIRRFFSPSTDPSEKVILGGSLTNWPATRDTKGKMLLRPVELSKHMKEIDMPKTLEELQSDLDAANANLATKEAELTAIKGNKPLTTDEEEVENLGQWMSSNGDGVEELSRQAQKRAELIIRAERRKDKVVEFASLIVGGTKEKPFGLPIRSSRIVKLLLSLPEKQAQEVQELIGLVYKNAVDFAEHGISGADYSMKPKLPVEMQSALDVWVASGKEAKAWFVEMGEGVGKADDWDLSKYAKVEV